MSQDLSGKPEAPHFLSELNPDSERPLSTNAADPRHKNAAGKKHCGLCAFKMTGQWACGNVSRFKCPYPEGMGRCPGFSQKPLRKKGTQGGKKKALPVPEGVKFLYFGRPQRGVDFLYRPKTGSQDHQGVVTVAWVTPVPGTLHLGFAFCSPEDHWCKATGRDMAAARLLKRTGPTIAIRYLYDAKRRAHEVARAVLNHDFAILEALVPGAVGWGHNRVPSWTKGLAKRMGEGQKVSPKDVADETAPTSDAAT